MAVEVSVEKPGLDLQEDKKKRRKVMMSYEDVPAELALSVVIEKLPVLSPEYSVSRGQLAYNKEWDERLQSYSQAQRRKVKISSPWLLIPIYLKVLSRKLAF